MNYFITVWLGLFDLAAANNGFINYKVRAHRRAEMEIISVIQTQSLTKCSLQCTNTQGCVGANWNATACELLRTYSDGMDLVEEQATSFLCEYVWFIIKLIESVIE